MKPPSCWFRARVLLPRTIPDSPISNRCPTPAAQPELPAPQIFEAVFSGQTGSARDQLRAGRRALI